MPSTEELVRSAQVGDASAFAELVRRYERVVIITAHSVLGDFHAAQDAAQEAFALAYGNVRQLRRAAAFGPWVLRIARREASRIQRRAHGQPAHQDTACPSAQREIDWTQLYEDVVRQLARLPEHERIAVVLRYVDGRSLKEIADATGRPVGTITKQLSRAIQRLRAWLVKVQS